MSEHIIQAIRNLAESIKHVRRENIDETTMGELKDLMRQLHEYVGKT